MKILRLTVTLILLTTIFFSCVVDEQCRQSKTVQFVANVYHVSINSQTGVITRTAKTLDSLTVRGLLTDTINNKYFYTDSVLYNSQKSLSSFNLPLHKFSNNSKYEVKFNAIADTITILHTNSDVYLSLECGCLKTHSIDTVLVTRHFIDSVSISNHTVNTTNAENLRIYK